MRTGPFSDPSMVALINRYFVPVHVDNRDGSAVRYGMEPGHENAYILFETPEVPGGPRVETVILGTLRQVLDPETARAELLAFLDKHARFRQPDSTVAALERSHDPDARMRLAEWLLEQGEADRALQVLADPGLPARAALLGARALRLTKRWTESAAALAAVPESVARADVEMERIRLTHASGELDRAALLLDAFLATHADADPSGEAHYLRGWLYHRDGRDDRALETWQAGIARYPPPTALYSQKAHLTRIRLNWDLPDNVDQPVGDHHDRPPSSRPFMPGAVVSHPDLCDR